MIASLILFAALAAPPDDPDFGPDPGPPPPGAEPGFGQRFGPGHGPGPGFRHHGPFGPPTWFDSAMSGSARRPWSGRVVLDLPGGRHDTARVCGGPNGFRIDFPNGRSMWRKGDSAAFLDSATATVRTGGGRHGFGPPPGLVKPTLLGRDTLLGRPALVYVLRGPRGEAHRMWVDTTLPLLLRGEGPGPGARRMLSLDLSKGCTESAFSIPTGWTVRRGPPDGPRPHEESSIEALEKAIGRKLPRPSWLPQGFAPVGQGWMRPRGTVMVHLRYSDGTGLVSVFVRDAKRPFEECGDDDRCPFRGPDPVEIRRVGDLSVLVTGSIPPADLRKLADGLR